jgi:hypothetical protein
MPRLSAEELARLEEAEARAIYIGTSVSTSFHSRLQQAARSKGLSLGGFLREALIENLQRSGEHQHERG